MSDGKNIDKLFADKLAGRQVAYSASAWAGANQLLNQHYKWLFLRSLLWVLVPIAVISGIGVGFYADDSITNNAEYTVRSTGQTTFNSIETASILHSSNKTLAENLESAIENSFTTTRQLENTSEAGETPQAIIHSRSIAEHTKQTEPNQGFENNVSTNSEVASVSRVSNISTNTSSQTHDSKSVDIEAIAANNNPDNVNIATSTSNKRMISNELAAVLLKNKIGYLPIPEFAFANEETGELMNSAISEPLMEEIRKIQVFAEGGLLVARGQHDLNVERKLPGIGLHAGLLTKYNLGESVFLDFKIGMYNRGSLTETVGFTGSQMNSFILVKPLLIHYASIYLGTGYRVGARHSFGGGFEFNPMIGVLAKKEKTMLGENSTETSYVKDNTGFAGLDAAVSVNYRLSVSERVDLTSELHFGLFDATDNSVFKTGDVNDNNTLIKVGLSYRLTGR